jgi:hypothetical protein
VTCSIHSWLVIYLGEFGHVVQPNPRWPYGLLVLLANVAAVTNCFYIGMWCVVTRTHLRWVRDVAQAVDVGLRVVAQCDELARPRVDGALRCMSGQHMSNNVHNHYIRSPIRFLQISLNFPSNRWKRLHHYTCMSPLCAVSWLRPRHTLIKKRWLDSIALTCNALAEDRP